MATAPEVIVGEWELTDKQDGTCVLTHQTTGETYTFDSSDGSLDAGRVNGVYWADSPDEMATLAQSVAGDTSTGGIIRLKPGTYGNADWTQTISIPNQNENYLGLDFSLANITLSSGGFAGPYIERPDSTLTSAGPGHVMIYGPRRFHVDQITSPGKVLHLWDIKQSLVWWPHCYGAVDAVLHKRARNGSGHQCVFNIHGGNPVNGIVIGDTGDPQTSDRCHYYGQIDTPEQVGIDIRYGQANQIWAQVEDDKTGFSATGVRDLHGNNIIRNVHEKTSRPLDIQAPYTTIETRALELSNTNTRIATAPNNILDPLFRKHIETWEHGLGKYTTVIPTGGNVDVINGECHLQGGTTDGNVAALQTPNGLGKPSFGMAIHHQFSLNATGNRRDRFGWYRDANNYAMVVGDSTHTDGAYHFKVVEGGVVQIDQTLTLNGTAITPDTGKHEVQLWLMDPNTFSVFWDYNHVGDFTYAWAGGGYEQWANTQRADVTVRGAPASGRNMVLNRFENGKFEQRYRSISS